VAVHHQSRDGGVEGVLRAGRLLEQPGVLVREEVLQPGAAADVVALVHPTREQPGPDLERERPARLVEGQDREARRPQRRQVWHAAQ